MGGRSKGVIRSFSPFNFQVRFLTVTHAILSVAISISCRVPLPPNPAPLPTPAFSTASISSFPASFHMLFLLFLPLSLLSTLPSPPPSFSLSINFPFFPSSNFPLLQHYLSSGKLLITGKVPASHSPFPSPLSMSTHAPLTHPAPTPPGPESSFGAALGRGKRRIAQP